MLTAKENEIYEFIRAYLIDRGRAPSVTEIGQAVKQASRGTTYRYLKQLVNKGYIELVKGKRNIRLLEDLPSLELPIMGGIAAGAPLENFDSVEMLNLQDLFGQASRFLLKVKGDSMLGDNICDGDYIVCEMRSLESIRSRDILVVEVPGGEITLKRLESQDDNSVILLASNPEYLPQTYAKADIRVRGVYCGLLRV